MNEHNPSFRAQLITRRTYNRPLDTSGTLFETWDQTIDRVIEHQRWLWERAKGDLLNLEENAELEELRGLMKARKVSVSGRTLWLGGTEVSKRREASQFNCSFGKVETVHDVVDANWLLLQGCGVGFEPVIGTLNGFAKPVSVEVVRSKRTIEDWEAGNRGMAHNGSRFWTNKDGSRVYRLSVGDSAEAWAKSVGKLLALKSPVDVVRLDFSQVRAAGIRLKGYGWISSGDETIARALEAICKLLSDRAGKLLSRMDILDILNHLGTTLSSRRSAEIATVPYGDPEWYAFATAKRDHWEKGLPHRAQSNNSLLFFQKPSRADLADLFTIIEKNGGSEPGFINAEAALKRAPWFKGVNPCAEILLGNKSFCNLVEVDLGKFRGNRSGLRRAIYIAARANYRQTCVNLDDGVLQRSWHELNEFLRLCGVGLTGIARYLRNDGLDGNRLKALRDAAQAGANSMADELGLPRPKAVTTVKPSGTLSKIMDTTEGAHKPLGRYIFNNINFSKYDPLVSLCRDAGYHVFDNPYDSTSTLIKVPVAYEDVEFTEVSPGKFVNLETAVEQLERYKLLMDNYVDHNCSITVSYDPSEVPEIIDWLEANWDHFVGVSWLYRNDPTKTAKDLGYPYLPQEVVTEEEFREYVSRLSPVDLDRGNSLEELGDEGCSTGACPIR